MIGANLSDQRNSRNAGRFKFINQRLAYCGSTSWFFHRSNLPEEAKPKEISLAKSNFALRRFKRPKKVKKHHWSGLRFHLTLLRYSDQDVI